MARLLTGLLKKGRKHLAWNLSQLTTEPLLKHPDSKKPFVVEVDASKQKWGLFCPTLGKSPSSIPWPTTKRNLPLPNNMITSGAENYWWLNWLTKCGATSWSELFIHLLFSLIIRT